MCAGFATRSIAPKAAIETIERVPQRAACNFWRQSHVGAAFGGLYPYALLERQGNRVCALLSMSVQHFGGCSAQGLSGVCHADI